GPDDPHDGDDLFRQQSRLDACCGRLADPDLHADGHVHAHQPGDAALLADRSLDRPDAGHHIPVLPRSREGLPDRGPDVRQAADDPRDPALGEELRAWRDPMLELRGVSKSYAGRTALQPIDLTLEPGRTTVLIGPSGCGKSTLLRLMIGL